MIEGQTAERKQQGMPGAASMTMAGATSPSFRAALIWASVISVATLAIATFELSMADWPSGLVLLVVVPLVALLFFGCIVWSATQLLRVRTDGVKFALPFLV